jgi:C4-dicarboxylate-binding protein DctP
LQNTIKKIIIKFNINGLKMKTVSLLFGFVLLLVYLTWIVLSPTEKSPKVPVEQLPASTEKVITLRFGHNTQIDSALHQAALRFASEVERKSNGRVDVKIFPAQELGDDHQMVEMARNGELDILLTPTAKMSVAIPSMQYADLPFFFPSREDVYAMLDGEPGQMLLDDLHEIGLIGVTFWENGFKHFTGNKPYLTPDDFKGEKIRVMKSRIIMEQFKSFGAKPVPIDFYTTRQALADKVVDGEENPLVAIVSMGFHEVQSDLTLSEHAYLGYVFSISEKVLKKLPHEIQLMLIETAKEITPWEREETRKREEKLIEIVKNSGVSIHKLSEEDRQKFAEKTAPIVRMFEEVIGSDIISKTEELLLKKYGPDPKAQEQIIIGIDADLSMDGKAAGLAIKRGVEMAVDTINAKGGILGKKLVVLAKDHRTISSIGVQNVKEFIERGDVAAIIGGLHSTVIQDEIETIQKGKMPYLIPWAAVAETIENGYKDNYLFRASANDRLASTFIVDYAVEHHKKPAIIVENSIWGRRNLQKMNAYLGNKGINSVASIVYNRGQKSFQKELGQIIKADADSLIMVANSKEGSLIVQALFKQNRALPIISHWGILGGTFFEENKEILQNIDLTFFQTFSFSKNNIPHCKELQKKYFMTFGEKLTDRSKASAGITQAYDLVHLLALAIEKAGSTDHTKVKEALENLPPYDGIVKQYAPAFSADNHDALSEKDYFMARFGPDGTVIPVTK